MHLAGGMGELSTHTSGTVRCRPAQQQCNLSAFLLQHQQPQWQVDGEQRTGHQPPATRARGHLPAAHLQLVPALVRRHFGQEGGSAAAACDWVHKLDDEACNRPPEQRPGRASKVGSQQQGE